MTTGLLSVLLRLVPPTPRHILPDSVETIPFLGAGGLLQEPVGELGPAVDHAGDAVDRQTVSVVLGVELLDPGLGLGGEGVVFGEDEVEFGGGVESGVAEIGFGWVCGRCWAGEEGDQAWARAGV